MNNPPTPFEKFSQIFRGELGNGTIIEAFQRAQTKYTQQTTLKPPYDSYRNYWRVTKRKS